MSAGYDLQYALCLVLCTVGTCVSAVHTSLHCQLVTLGTAQLGCRSHVK